jgi:hypothetical protein
MSKFIPAALFAALLACNSKPTWTEYKSGPVTMQFPCKPETAAAATKCMRSDGALFKLDVVDKVDADGKPIASEAALKTANEYVEQMQNAQVVQINEFPVKWRETRRTSTAEMWLFYKEGKEYTFTVEYSAQKAPAEAAEFFSKIQFQQ